MRHFIPYATFALTVALLTAGCGPKPAGDGFVHQNGSLSSGDATLTTGEYADEFTVSAQPGQWIEVSLTSSEFDPYLILQPPGCVTNAGVPCDGQKDNDDLDASGTQAYFWHQVTEPGTWEIKATSSRPGESGAYNLAYRVAQAGEQPSTPGIRTLADGATRNEQGSLMSGDKTLESGEFVDYYSFFGRQGQSVVVDLTSSSFDPYLLLVMPDGNQLDNDDWEGDRTRSRIETTLPANGMYRVGATTYQPGESGSYRVQIGGSGMSAQPEAPESGDPFTKQ